MTPENDIRDLLTTYERSLNTSDAALATACFTSDGVFMPTTLPTAVGDGLYNAYAGTFAAIKLSVTFTIDELVIATDELAYALTRSKGTQTVLRTGDQSDESNREVFIFAREKGAWKISRYLFNKPQ
jgi:ketosteroid isomerase-like protein